MLARFCWPLQSRGRRHRASLAILACASAVALVIAAGPSAVGALDAQRGMELLVPLAVLALAAPSLGAWLGAAVALMLGLLAMCALNPSRGAPLVLMSAVGAAVLLPALLALRTARSEARMPHAAGRAAAWICCSWSLLAPFAWLVPWPDASIVVGLSAIAAGGLMLPIALHRTRPTSASDLYPLPLLRLHVAPLILAPMQRAVLAMVGAGIISLGLRARHDADLAAHAIWWFLPAFSLGAWYLTTGNPRLAWSMVVVALGWLGYAFMPRDSQPFGQLLLAFALAQLMPLALWQTRQRDLGWPGIMLGALGALCALALADQGLAVAVLGAALAGCLAVAVCEPAPLAEVARTPGAHAAEDRSPERILLLARRACQRLEPYWRFYGTGKLRHDPVYAQLADDAETWGRVLDAGCGPGLVAALCAARGETAYCGIDLDEDKLDAARRLLFLLRRPLDDRWQLLRGHLPFQQPLPQRFDTAFLIDVLHYWPADQQRALLMHLREALVAGGRLILRDACAVNGDDAGLVGAGERFTTFFGLNPGTGTLCFLSEDAMRDLLAASGFTIETCTVSGGENRLWHCRRRDSSEPALKKQSASASPSQQ